MTINDRGAKIRDAIIIFIDKIIPRISPDLQPLLANLAWLMANHFFSPEASQELYLKLQRIWHDESLTTKEQTELLTYCAWKLRLYLTFNQPKTAFELFQHITKTVQYRENNLGDVLKVHCLPRSESFPLPKIPKEDIRFLFNVGELIQQTQSNLTVPRIADHINFSREETVSLLRKLEMVFGCMIAVEALGLYWIRAEINIPPYYNIMELVERFKPFAYRCEAHSLPSKLNKGSDFQPDRLSVRFLYPITCKNDLFSWARKNGVFLLRNVEEHLFQNFEVLNEERWHPLAVSPLKTNTQKISIKYNANKTEVNQRVLQIVDTYLRPASFIGTGKIEPADFMLPLHRLGEYLKMGRSQAYQIVTTLFTQQILVPFFLSDLLLYTPDKILEIPEVLATDEARGYLYARSHMYYPLNEEKRDWDESRKITRLYVPEIVPRSLEKYDFRTVKRLFYASPRPALQINSYNVYSADWNPPKLPRLNDLL